MANSVKLLNYVDPDGEFIKFYTELDANFQVGDRVFIVGGNYDNSTLAESDPYNEYAAGYTIVAADLTNISNSITLNIKYNDSRFSANPTSTLFEPFTVYLSRLDTFKNINSSTEAYITKNRFTRGEFNGGAHIDGVFGEYKRYDDVTEATYTNALASANINHDDLNAVQDFFYNYNIQETAIPIEEFQTYYNRKEENDPAVFSGGVFFGGNWQWGQWISNYPSNQAGKYQQLSALGGIRDPLDQSKFNIQNFTNNFNGLGYNIATSGNFGRIWTGELMLFFDDVNNQINFNFIPFALKRALRNAFNVKLDVQILDESAAYRNSKNFTINFDPTPNSSDFTLLASNIVKVYERVYVDPNFGTDAFRHVFVQIEIADPSQILLADPQKRTLAQIAPNRSSKDNSIQTGRVQDADFYQGIWLSGQFQGGEWWNGEFRSGRIGSILRRTTWHDGYFNGSSSAFANDVFWQNGTWQNGSWEGARNFKINSLIKLPIISGVRNTNVQLDIVWENMFQIGETVLLSYFKNSNSTLYLNNWTNDYKQNLLEFQTFKILNIIHDYTNRRLLLTIDLNLDNISGLNYTTNIFTETVVDLNYQFARISNSYFNNGLWFNGNWQNGYFNGNLKPLSVQSFTQQTLTLQVADVTGLENGQFLELSNLRIVYKFNFITLLGGTLGTAAGGVDVDDRANQEYWLNVEQRLQILDLDLVNNLIILDISTVMESIQENVIITNITTYYPNVNDDRPGLLGYTTQIWENGTFNTGVFENGIWKDGVFRNIFIEDPTNSQNKSIWRSGVWLNGNWDSGVFLSGIWESGVWINGIMTNGWKRSTALWNGVGSWMQGDSIWYDGEWLNGQWLRGLWKKGVFENGIIQNAGIDEIEIKNGSYLNGKVDTSNNPIFSSANNTTNALNSAPALIFIDQEGWVQLDQASWYQVDYNVIIKDLYLRDNPFNNQMFNILDRNTTASRLKISTVGNDGTNGADIPQSFIDSSLPIVVIQNIVDLVETDPSVYWFADQAYKRIIEVNNSTGNKVFKVIGDIINDVDENTSLVFGTILKITTDNALDQNNLTRTRWVYVLESNRITRINKDTNVLEVVVTFTTLQNDLTINLQEWVDIFVYPVQTGIPETLFILARVQTSVNNIFVNKFVVIAFNMVTKVYNILNFTGSNINDANIPQEWLTGLTANSLTLSSLKIRGFSLGEALNIFYKLPIDIAGASYSYQSNNVQRQRLSFVNNSWTISEYAVNVIPTVNLTLNSQPYIFKDFAVRVLSPDFRYFLLSTDNQSIYYTLTAGGLVPLVTSVNVDFIDFGIDQILAIRPEFGFNMSPVIIPQVTRRFGAIDTNSKLRVLETVNSVPASSSEIVQWYIDQPTNRLLKLSESKAPDLYDISDEFGIENAQMLKITFINDTENFNRLIMIEVQTDGTKAIILFNKISASIDRGLVGYYLVGAPAGDIANTGLAINSIIVDVYYENGYIFNLYKKGNLYFYDYYRVDKQLSNNSFANPVTIASPILIAHADEIFTGTVDSTNNKVVYIANANNIVNNFNLTIFTTINDQTIVDFAFISSANDKRYLYVATVDTSAVYRIYRVTKKFLTYSDTVAWPGNNNGAGPSTLDLIYQSLTPIEKLYSNVGGLEKMVANLTNAVDLLSLEYTNQAIKNVSEFVYSSNTDYWIADNVTNRVVKYHNYGTSGNILDLDFGQYQQPFEAGRYTRHINSLRYLEWNSNKFIVFLDENYATQNKVVRAININNNQNSSADTVVIQQLINGVNDIQSIADLFGDYIFPYVFDPSGTSGTAGTYVPPGLSGNRNFEFLDLWTKNIANTGVLKILIRDNSLNIYQILTLTHTVQGATTFNLEEVAAGTAGFAFQQFTVEGSNVYLSNNTDIYKYNGTSVALIESLPANIQNLFMTDNSSAGTSGIRLYALTNNNTTRRLFRMDYNGSIFAQPIADDNDTIFKSLDYADANFDLDKIIIKSSFTANRVQTTSVNNIIDNIKKVSKYNGIVFAHNDTTVYKLNSTTVNYVDLQITALFNNVKKIISFSENLCYAIYQNSAIVAYDFSNLTATVLNIQPSYSDAAYHYTAIDIAKVPGKLAILYRILSNSTSGESYLNNYTDIWLYDLANAGTSGFSQVEFEYNNDHVLDSLDPVLYLAGTNTNLTAGTAGLGNNSTITAYTGTLTNLPIAPTTLRFDFEIDTTISVESLGNGSNTTGPYNGSLAHGNIIPSTLVIDAGTNGSGTNGIGMIIDNGAGILTGDGSGTINYLTGAFTFTTTSPIFTSQPITASYVYKNLQSITDNGVNVLTGNGSGTINYSTGNYSFTTTLAVPNTSAIRYSYGYTTLVYQLDNGRPYSVKGKFLSGDDTTSLWVYHNNNTGLVWKVESGDNTITVANNATEFNITNDVVWAVLDNTNTTNVQNNVTSYTVTNSSYTTLFTDNNSTIFSIADNVYYYSITNLNNATSFDFIPKTTFNWYLDQTVTVTPGTETFNQSIFQTTKLSNYRTEFSGEAFFNSYSAYTDLSTTSNSTNSLISPNVTGRVLYDTIWRNGQFNTGVNNTNSAYTAYLVSSRWLSGTFRGSWDTPRYLDNYALRQESLFLGGVFGDTITGDPNTNLTAIWNDGLFLGGDWKTGQFLSGHFFSENPILVENISFPNIVINQITQIEWDYSAQAIRVNVNHFKWDPTVSSYVSTASQLAKYNLIQIPGLFKDFKITIQQIRKNKYPISGFNEIILICDTPTFAYPTNWLIGTYVYISGLTSYIEYLYGEHYVTDTFTYQNQYWITVRSDFDQFNSNGVINFTKKPYVSFNLLRIDSITFSSDLTTSSLLLKIPVSNDTIINQVEFIKNAFVNDSVDIIDDVFEGPYGTNGTAGTALALDFGKIVLDETFQVYSRSVNGVNSTITLNNVTSLNTILLNNVTSVNYTGTSDIYDITVYKSNVTSTLNQTTTNFHILNSLFMSGTTNIPLKDSGWMNRDNTGFPYATSTLNAIAFDGDVIQIIDFEIDPNDSTVFILELLRPLVDLNVNQYIYIRGFSGNKANLIGAAVSRAFRVLKINQNKVSIRNPFIFYNDKNILTDNFYRTRFDANQLIPYEQTMNLKRDLSYKFNYTYASTNTWNGGTFVGNLTTTSNFNGVWNAGTFAPLNNNSTFNGEWFSTPSNYYWAGQIFINVTQNGNSFVLELNLATVGLNWNEGDLIRVDFINNSPTGFYANIANLKVSNTYSIFFNAGYYTVNIVRLKNKYLIQDRNLAIGPETDQAYHLIFDKNIYNWSAGNAALLFDGTVNFNISYVIQAVNDTNNSFAFDFWFNALNATNEPLISFRMTNADFTVFVSFDGINYLLNMQYSLSSTSYISVTKIIDTSWHHLYIDDLFGNFFAYFDATDTIAFNPSGAIILQTGVWTITSLNYTGSLFIDRNTLREILIGKFKHTNTLYSIAQNGAIDQLRFWNVLLTSTAIDKIYNAKILAKRFPEIAAQITFDDPAAEYLNVHDDKLRISNIEYVSNIQLRATVSNEFMLYLNFEIEQLESYTPLVKFSTAPIQNLIFENPYQMLAVNNGFAIDFYVEQVKFKDSIIFPYNGVVGSLPNVTDFANQFFYNTSSLNGFIFSYEAECNLGTGVVLEHGFVFSNSNTATWNIVPRLYVTFKNDGVNSTVNILTGVNAATPITVASFNLNTLTPIQQFTPAFTKYTVYTTVDSLNNINIKVILGTNQYGKEIFNTIIPSTIPLNSTVYVANAYGSFNTKFKNRSVESYNYLSTANYGNTTDVYITNKKWIFNRTTVFANITELQTTEVFNLNLPKLFHFGDETVSNINSESLIKYNEINVFNNTNVIANEFTAINNLLNGDNTALSLLSYINQDNYQNYSNYFIIYPKIGNYGIPISDGTAGTSGNAFIISGIGTPETVTNFNYYTGSSLATLRLSDQYGTNLDLYPVGGPIIDPLYYTSETFVLQTNGTPRWTQDNVTFTSAFNNGNYISKVWRAGIFNNGLINISNFVWKWGTATGGSIIDVGF